MKEKILSSIVLVLLLAPSLAAAQPSVPHQFYGTASYTNGTTPANGTTVEAKIGSDVVESSTVTSGKYGYSPNVFFVEDSSGSRAGQTVKLYLDGKDSGQTAVFANGGYTRVDLSVEAPSVGNNGGGGGPPTLTTIPPAVTNLTEAQKPYDVNSDARIDVLDFNALIVHWGETGSA
ncbi:MAG: hypothetical protein Q7K33_01510, partial [Candidatus Berkelbacteria bacterium]|nr:hypothetical protein [Candidatus Berkelbacteria bacterium]